MGLKAAADEIKNPKGEREFSPDMSATPFVAVAEDIANRAILEMGACGFSGTIQQWGRAVSAHALYNMAYPPPD